MLITITGESGSGKSSIERKLEVRGFKRIISYTTRRPRLGEVRNVNYYYISKLRFFIKKLLNHFGEYTKYNGNYYVASLKDLLKDNSIGVFEPAGCKQIKNNKKINSISFYIFVSEEERRKRMLSRGDDPKLVEDRITKDREIFKDFPSKCDYIVTNNNIDDTVEKIIGLIEVNTNKIGG